MDEKKQLARLMAMEYFRQNNLFKNDDSQKSIESIALDYLNTENDFLRVIKNNPILLKRMPND